MDQIVRSGYRLAYTSVTLYELRRSPRPEIKPWRREILSFLRFRRRPGRAQLWRLIDPVYFASKVYRHDGAVALTAEPHVLLTLDA